MKYAIISVWDKTGVCEFARLLINKGYRILSTGGTYTAIKSSLTPEQQKNLTKVSNYTGFPEILGGRVKTLHPKIHAGILAREDQLDELEGMGLAKISVVVANLYPFAEAMQSGIEALALENIDIGGHTLIRAAAKNYPNTLVLTDPADYSHIDNLTVNERRIFAQKAFAHAAEYDISIARYFGDQTVRKYYPIHELKYGCNPHQDHAALCGINTNDVPLQVLNGSLGYINVIDALLGYQLVCEASLRLGVPAAASYKHTSPAGVGLGRELCYAETQVFDVLGRSLTPVATAFIRARNCDPLSSFGDFISISDPVDCCTAELVKREVQRLRPQDRDFYRVGAAQSLYETVIRPNAETPNVARQFFGGSLFGRPNINSQRLRALFVDAPEVADDFMRQVAAETRLSHTATRTLGAAPGLGVQKAEQALEGSLPTVRASIGVTALNVARTGILRAQTGWSRDVSDNLADIFTRGLTNPNDIRAVLQSIFAEGERIASRTAGKRVTIELGKLAGRF